MNCCFTIILFNFEQIKACGASGTGMQLVCQCFGHFCNFRILSPYRQTSIINVLSDTVTPFRQTSIINVLSNNVKFPFWLTSQTTPVCVAKITAIFGLRCIINAIHYFSMVSLCLLNPHYARNLICFSAQDKIAWFILACAPEDD